MLYNIKRIFLIINTCICVRKIVPLQRPITFHMKKALFFSALAALFLMGCKGTNDPEQYHAVTFRIPELQVTTEPMDAPHRVAPLTDDDGAQMSDLFIYDGSVEIAHQTNADASFGTVTVMLTTGEHHLHFIATRSTELIYDEGILNCTSLRPTFGKHFDLNVTGSSDQNLNLDRITGQVIITIEDEIPSGASQLRIQMGDYYKGINPTTFAAIRSGEFDQTVNIAGKIGLSGQTWTLNILVPEYGVEHETTYTITATNGSGGVIGQCTGTMPCNSNTKTLLHGNLFTGTRAMVSLVTSWNADEDVTF